MGLCHGIRVSHWLGRIYFAFDWMTASGLGGALIGLATGGGLIAIIGFSYGYAIKALPVTEAVLSSEWSPWGAPTRLSQDGS